MKRALRNRLIAGFTALEVLTVAGLIAQVPEGAYATAKSKGDQTKCFNNLKQIGQFIQMFVDDNGAYPKAAFYPKSPKTDPASIRAMMPDVPESMWICPGVPDAIKQHGLTFVYNDVIGGKRGFKDPSKKWVLIEVNCVSSKASPPHINGYNVLFADGHVITTKRLPNKITASQQAAVDSIRRALEDGTMVACNH